MVNSRSITFFCHIGHFQSHFKVKTAILANMFIWQYVFLIHRFSLFSPIFPPFFTLFHTFFTLFHTFFHTFFSHTFHTFFTLFTFFPHFFHTFSHLLARWCRYCFSIVFQSLNHVSIVFQSLKHFSIVFQSLNRFYIVKSVKLARWSLIVDCFSIVESFLYC